MTRRFSTRLARSASRIRRRLARSKWRRLERAPRYEVKTEPRTRPENGKERVVREREFKNIKLCSEDVAEFDDSPVACKKTCRVVIVRKNLSIEKGEAALFDELKNEVCSLRAPADNLISNWAYMVMVSIAWSLKAWFALMMPISPRWQDRHLAAKTSFLRMSFRTFVNRIVLMPAQIVSTGRRLIYRLLSWTPWQSDVFRTVEALNHPLRC